MKKLFGLLIGTIAVCALQAQKAPSPKDLQKHQNRVNNSLRRGTVLLSLDTIFKSGAPYCLCKPIGRGILGVSQYSISPLIGQEEIHVQLVSEGTGSAAVHYWDMSFLKRGQKLRIPRSESFSRLVVDYGLFTENAINLEAVDRLFLIKMPPSIIAPGAAINGPGVAVDQRVNRNQSANIHISGQQIRQGGVVIGTILQETINTPGDMHHRITVRYTNGNVVAVARNGGIADHEWFITIMADNRQFSVSSSAGRGTLDVATKLVELQYL
jgi:hypothetical protein